MKVVLIRKENVIKGGQKMAKAYINGVEVTIYEFQGDKARCYVPEYDLTNWYRLDQIEV